MNWCISYLLICMLFVIDSFCLQSQRCCNVWFEDILTFGTKTLKCLSGDPSSTVPSFLLHRSLKTWGAGITSVLQRSFPLDKESRNYVRKVDNVIFSKTNPTPFSTPSDIVAYSESVLSELINFQHVITSNRHFQLFVSGGAVLNGFEPITHRYGGHQFGHWSGQLGDGRAHLISEFVNHQGHHIELQLKGSGRTPYSRRGDGRAVVRSSVREFLCSEAMYYLGIPTSRAVTIAVSGDYVMRDQFYDGNPIKEPTAVVLRLAESWFRFGSFEILTDHGEIDLLRSLADFVISYHFPQIDAYNPNKYLALYSSVVEETAMLMVKWQSVGFAHGVCNTDNFSILSITIDYGPFRFMDEYDPNMVPNTSDDEAMYSYKNQPTVGKFNLNKLRLALEPLIAKSERAVLKQILAGYESLYQDKYLTLFRTKLGIIGNHEMDDSLIELLLGIMQDTKSDFTMTFRQLGDWQHKDIVANSIPKSLWALRTMQSHAQFKYWSELYAKRLMHTHMTDEARRKLMHNINPRYVLRNWIAQDVIKYVEKGDYRLLNEVQVILMNPYKEQEKAELLGFADPPPRWADHIRVSCSS